MHPDTYEFLAHDRIDTIRRDAAVTAVVTPERHRKVAARPRRTVAGAVLAFALGGFLGSASTATAIDRDPPAASAEADDRASTVPPPSVNVADDPGYGDGFGSGRRLLPGRG
jgi:hypothetical protein